SLFHPLRPLSLSLRRTCRHLGSLLFPYTTLFRSLIGLEDVMLTQEKFSPVITIRSEDVTIENVHIRHLDESGESPAILVNSDHNSLQDIEVHTNSYGIQLD